MKTVNSIDEPGLSGGAKSQVKSKSNFLKILLFGVLFIIVALTALHFIWKSSGSNEWEFVHEIDGVKVYSLKEPGRVMKKFKVTGKLTSTLSGIVKLMRDPSACADVGCDKSRIIDDAGHPEIVYYTFQYPMPPPLKPREFVVKSEFRQDPVSREIFMDYRAASDMLPPNDCCVRVTHMNNLWRFKPLGGGEVEVEFIMDNDPGGFMPYFLVNAEFEGEMHYEIPAIQDVLNKEKYQNAKYEYVQEYEANQDEVASSR